MKYKKHLSLLTILILGAAFLGYCAWIFFVGDAENLTILALTICTAILLISGLGMSSNYNNTQGNIVGIVMISFGCSLVSGMFLGSHMSDPFDSHYLYASIIAGILAFLLLIAGVKHLK